MFKLISTALLITSFATPVIANDEGEPYGYSFDIDGDKCDGTLIADINYEGMIFIDRSNKYTVNGTFAIQSEKIIGDVIQYITTDESRQQVTINVSYDGYIFDWPDYNGGHDFRSEGNADVLKLVRCW